MLDRQLWKIHSPTHLSRSEHLYWIPFQPGTFILSGLNSLCTQQYFWLWTRKRICFFPRSSFPFSLKTAHRQHGRPTLPAFTQKQAPVPTAALVFPSTHPYSRAPFPGGGGIVRAAKGIIRLWPVCLLCAAITRYDTDCSPFCDLCPCSLTAWSSF